MPEMEGKFYIDQTPFKMPDSKAVVGPEDITKAQASGSTFY
jgi:hypothetical protein